VQTCGPLRTFNYSIACEFQFSNILFLDSVIDSVSGKMRKFVSLVLVLFVVVTVVCSNKWALDSRVEVKLNGLVKRFHSRAVSIFGRLVLQTMLSYDH